MLTLDTIKDLVVEVEEARKKIDQPIVEWLESQGVFGFDSKKHNVILPSHMRELFTGNIPEWLQFSPLVEFDRLLVVDKFKMEYRL